MEWITKRAKELYVSSSGLSKSADQFGFGYPFLSYTEIFHYYYAPNELKTLVNSTEKDQEKCSVHRGDVFLTRTSETTEELGMSCVALKDYPYATFNGFAKRLRPITDEIVPEYAAYFFRSAYFRTQCMSMASLITRASLNDSMISRFKIRYPKEKSVQAKIGQTLNTYDNLIENNTKRIKLLEQMAENLYKEWFVRFRFPGHENVEMENGLPKGWKEEILGERYSITIGKTPPRKEFQWFTQGDSSAQNWLSISDMKDMFTGYTSEQITKEAVKKFNMVVVPENTILLSFKLTVGRTTIALQPLCTNEAIAHIKQVPLLEHEYLYQLLKNYEYDKLGNTSAIGNAINSKIVKAMKIVIPTAELLLQYHKITSPIFVHIKNLLQQNQLLTRQRDLLLPRLMSGKLEVTVR